MRELLLFHIYSGHLFFTAAAIFLGMVVLDLSGFLARRPLMLRAARVLALLSILLAGLSGTPLPAVVWIITLLTTLTYVLLRLGRSDQSPRVLAVVAIANVLVCLTYEASWHRDRVYAQRPPRLIVIGDSLSSGGFGEALAWPALFARRLGVPLVNLAAPSDSATGALRNQIPNLPPPKAADLAIVEIGGHDMLDGVDPREFERALDQILTALSGRQIVMFELPLIPGRWRYGAIQRRLTVQHRALLAPKRILARVLVDPRNTSDGLHLTQRGHEALAGALSAWLQISDQSERRK
jgi:acyl-CoA thioesterase-1